MLKHIIRNQMITHEYNEYVLGYIVKMADCRSCNFQFEKIFSNHPQPNYTLKFGCEGDDTWLQFTEDELQQMTDYLLAQADVKATLEKLNNL